MSKPIQECPACHTRLEVQELGCPVCSISIRGKFEGCEFCALPQEQLSFLRLFVSRRGNLREVERELGISYPTVRARLDDLLEALGHPVSPTPIAERQQRRRQVIEELKSGEISPEDAIRALKQ